MSPENEQYDDASLQDFHASGPVIARGSRASRCCSRCLNHGLRISITGHKRYCKYRLCSCQKCVFTVERQRVMAQQTALRRLEVLEETRNIGVHEAVVESSVNPEINHLQQQVISSTNSQPLPCLDDDLNIIENNMQQADNQDISTVNNGECFNEKSISFATFLSSLVFLSYLLGPSLGHGF